MVVCGSLEVEMGGKLRVHAVPVAVLVVHGRHLLRIIAEAMQGEVEQSSNGGEYERGG
jgi:hypothetical protein